MKKFLLLISVYVFFFDASAKKDKNLSVMSIDTISYHELQEIAVVSNPKSQINTFEFPGSLTTFSAANIERMNIQSLKDFSSLAPNLYIPDYGSRLTSAIYIRGIGSRINSPAVGLNIDNVPYLDKSAFDFDFMDIERVEILRGPQGTLYGRNTMAGLINVYTKSPFDNEGTRIRAGYGNYNAKEFGLSHTHKINDHIAFSLSGQYKGHDGYFTNRHTGKDADDSDMAGGRAKVTWRINDKTKIDFTSDFQYSKQNGYPYYLYDKKTGESGNINYNDEGSYRRTVSTNSISLEYKHDRYTLTSTTGYQFLDDDMRLDQDFTPLSIFTLQQKQKEHAISQEIAFRSTTSKKLQWVAGVYGFYQSLRTNAPVDFKEDGIQYMIEDQTNTQLKKLAAMIPSMPVLNMDVTNPNLLIDGRYKTPSFGLAVFKQMTYNDLFTEGLSGTIGLRLDYEHQKFTHHTFSTDSLRSNITGNMVIERPPMAGGNLTIPIRSKLNFPLDITGKDDMNTLELLPKFELKYDMGDKYFFYGSIAKGYRSGGYNVQMFSNLIQSQLQTKTMEGLMSMIPPSVTLPDGMGGNASTESINLNDVISYKPEHSWNYEIGTRANLFDYRLTVDLSAFYIACRDQQIGVVSGYGRITKNSGRSVSKGIETALHIRPVNRLHFGVSYGYTHATFTENNDGETDYKGKYIPFAPKHTLSVTGDYCIPVNRNWLDRINLSAQYTGKGKIYWTEANDAYQNFYGLTNAEVQFDKGDFSLSVWGKNIFDQGYQSFYFETMNAENLSKNNGFAEKGRPATFGATVQYKF